MKRVPPSVRLKEEIDRSVAGHRSRASAPEEPPMVGFVGRLARYMLQVAIEAEATAFLGREHYRRGERQRVGWRNGYEPKQVQSEAGALELAVPQLRGTEDAVSADGGGPAARPARRISRAWCAACMSAGCPRRMSARSTPTPSAGAA